MIRLLICLHPRTWRRRYGEEFRALLEAAPLTVPVVLDVLLHAARQHARARPGTARVAGAVALSVMIELGAYHGHLTDNILWSPTTLGRAVALAVLALSWLPVARHVVEVVGRRRDPT